MPLKSQTRGYCMVALASILWGSMGIIGQMLYQQGLKANHIVFWKLIFGFIIILIYLLITDKTLLRIDKKGLMYLSLMGLICQASYNYFIFSAIAYTGIATATILLYTSPIFVIIMSRLFYKENITSIKLMALLMCMGGSFLTVTEGALAALKLNPIGIIMGLAAGFTFAITTISTKALVSRYSRWTICLYVFGFGALFAIPISNPLSILEINPGPSTWLGLFLLGLLPTALGYGLYITGISYNIEMSKTGILTTLEIIVAVVAASLIFGDKIWGYKLLGILMVFLSVIIIQIEISTKIFIKEKLGALKLFINKKRSKGESV
ncbi:DMT family transporter [Alkaliphilus peptidifermentans]|uniref:EamA domain-containing membrane protein RarD n=1 Tax=Alkaliphilus peptidifermentans DSM 18978 TaxID=1120976 RepID=A0A1G5JR77_9FIRM|nr:DMT family transporter [Alkaliphilus peptidifermentans]SCY90895.1 EamA domain-containing membrane protein RarD [Alkaliphilus peptidifermentans DSM 18978]